MSCWVVAPGRSYVLLPSGIKVGPGVVLEGEQYRQYAQMGLLVEAPRKPVKESLDRPQLLTEIQPLPNMEEDLKSSETDGDMSAMDMSDESDDLPQARKARPRKKG